MSILIAVLGLALSVGTFFIGRVTAAKKDGVEDGEMKSDVRHIKNDVDKQGGKLDQVVENYEEIKIELERLKGRMTALEQKVNMLHGGDGA
jgi:peptidoglycan hydrolase CwlO-like protein